MAGDSNELMIADRIDGLLQPFEHGLFVGQAESEARFLAAAGSQRLHHAWLFCGPSGVGKATFAFRLARHFLSVHGQASAVTTDDLDRAADPNNPVFRKVARGGHPNILHLRVPMQESGKGFRTVITVEEVRRTVGFFGSTAGDLGWRIALIDSANDMNLNAANALLKILEEPPPRTLFFLLSDQESRLLPTIRSRCQRLAFRALDDAPLARALRNAAPDLADGDIATAIRDHGAIIGGSVRRAYRFSAGDTADILMTFQHLLDAGPAYSMAELHRFADQISARGADDLFALFVDYLESHLGAKVRQGGEARSLVRWAEVWDKVHARLALEKSINLDRKQTVLALFQDLRSANP